MRFAICLVVLVGCAGDGGESPLVATGCDVDSPCAPGEKSCSIPEANGLTKRCGCIETGASDPWWACSDCPFGETDTPVSCSQPGLSCNITTWEHDCACGCTAEGWWSCSAGTIGSHCPTPPSSGS